MLQMSVLACITEPDQHLTTRQNIVDYDKKFTFYHISLFELISLRYYVRKEMWQSLFLSINSHDTQTFSFSP
jgi:hypothetical protein